MLPVVARPEVADDLAGLSPALLRAIRRLLPALKTDPLRASLPLDYDARIGNLGDCRKVYFDEAADIRPAGYRIVLRLLPDEGAPEPDRQHRAAGQSRGLPSSRSPPRTLN